MKTLAILISGRGSNMLSVVQACRERAWPARIGCVVSNRPEAAGLALARQWGLATEVVDHTAFSDRRAFEAALLESLDGVQPDLIVLAGFMRILSPEFVGHFAGRIVNIHPSLLPAFPGLGTHRKALEAGVTVHGATVHMVTPVLDHGPILAQAAVPVRLSDDAATLAARVLRHEHELYPRAIEWLVHDRVQERDGRLVVDGVADSERLIWGVGDE